MSEESSQLATTGGAEVIPWDRMQSMAGVMARSAMFGVKNEDQAMALMLLCQAEGLNPVMALRRYHLIEGRPSMRADAMAGEFESRGGGIVWHLRTDKVCAATFFADRKKMDEKAVERGRARCRAIMDDNLKELINLSMAGEETIVRTAEDAWNKGISRTYKDGQPVLKTNWASHPRQMLTARVSTEGVRLVNPGLVAGIYDEDEIRDSQAVEVHEAVKTDPKAGDRAAIEAIIKQHQEDAAAATTEAQRRHFHGLIADLKLKLDELSPEPVTAKETTEPTPEPLASTQAQPEPTPEPEPTEKPAQAKVVTPEPTHDLKVVEKDPDWRTVVSHIGNAGGPVFGKQVGEMKPKVLEWVKTTLEKKAHEAGGKLTNQKDATLYWAVKKAMEPQPEPTPEPATPEPASVAWASAVVPAGFPGEGKAIEELSSQEIGLLREYMESPDLELTGDEQKAFKPLWVEALNHLKPGTAEAPKTEEKPKRAPRKPKDPPSDGGAAAAPATTKPKGPQPVGAAAAEQGRLI